VSSVRSAEFRCDLLSSLSAFAMFQSVAPINQFPSNKKAAACWIQLMLTGTWIQAATRWILLY
jgi:hypothetical protein